jgi:hypothetical protein
MNAKLLLWIVLAFSFTTGCNRTSTEHHTKTGQSHAAKVYTEVELEKLITPGMSITDVTNRFGVPGSAVQISKGLVHFSYSFPFEVKSPEAGPYLTGFSIDIKDGRVIRWFPVTSMTGKTIQGGAPQASFGEQSFQIFLVTDSLTNVVNTVDSEGSSDANRLKTPPNLEFNAKVFTGRSGNERPGEQTVILVVSEQDASKMKDLTENNYGKRLLFVCRNKVIAAPKVSAPVASRQVLFTVKNSGVLDNLRNQ